MILLSPVALVKLRDFFLPISGTRLFKVPYTPHVSLFVIDKSVLVASPLGIDSGDKAQVTVEIHLITGTE